MPHYPKRQQNEKKVIRDNIAISRILLRAFAYAEEAPIKKFIDPHNVNHSPHPPAPDASGRPVSELEEVELQREAFPDQHYAEDLVIAEGDMVYLGWHGTATFSGTVYGHKGTGEFLDVHGAEVLRFKNGKVVEHWDHFTKPRLEALIDVGTWDDKMVEALRQAGLL
jgi:predicted ester cyclase